MSRAPTPIVRLAPLLCLVACGEADRPSALGTLERDRLDLVAEASEPIVARPVAEGATVAAGELIVKLDPSRLETQVARAESARTRAAARLAELVRGPRQEQIGEARARLKGSQGRLASTRRDLARSRDLLARDVTSQQQLDEQQARFDEALAARDVARASLDALLEGTTSEELAQAEAALAEADATLADAHIRLARLEVRAPIAGRVDALPFELGERPPAGGVVAVLLADVAPYARVYVPEAIRVHVVPGTAAWVHVDGIERPLPGRVRSVAGEASFTPYFALTERDRGRLVYLAKIDLSGPETRSLPTGIPVEVEFPSEAPIVEPSDVRARD